MIGAPVTSNGCKSAADGTYTCSPAPPAQAGRETFYGNAGPSLQPPKPTLSMPPPITTTTKKI